MTDPMVSLRNERNGEDVRYLDAKLDSNGDLLLVGMDLGPAAEVMGRDDYEWTTRVVEAELPALIEALGGSTGEHILEVLERRATGTGSYELERLLREEIVTSRTHVY